MTTITPTSHEKNEWARLAQAAYRSGATGVGHRFSVAASGRADAEMPLPMFDALQFVYRRWFVDGVLVEAGSDRGVL
jgi:hypothetical protein